MRRRTRRRYGCGRLTMIVGHVDTDERTSRNRTENHELSATPSTDLYRTGKPRTSRRKQPGQGASAEIVGGRGGPHLDELCPISLPREVRSSTSRASYRVQKNFEERGPRCRIENAMTTTSPSGQPSSRRDRQPATEHAQRAVSGAPDQGKAGMHLSTPPNLSNPLLMAAGRSAAPPVKPDTESVRLHTTRLGPVTLSLVHSPLPKPSSEVSALLTPPMPCGHSRWGY